MIISGGKLLRPSTATKSRNPPDDSPSHPEARRLHWKEAAPSAIDVRLHRQRRNPPDDSPSHPEARRLLSGEIPLGIPKLPIRRNATCAPSPTRPLPTAPCRVRANSDAGRLPRADCPRTRPTARALGRLSAQSAAQKSTGVSRQTREDKHMGQESTPLVTS